MDEGMIESIRKSMSLKNTDELLKIWEENDRSKWSDEAFFIVKQLLLSRGEPLPIQNDYESIPVVKWSLRLANVLLDMFVISTLGKIILLILPHTSEGYTTESVDIMFFLLGIFYYIIFETLFQRTLAKFITKTKVIMVGGAKPSVDTIIKRTLIRYIPFILFSGSRGTWWHDRWTKTRVVDVSSVILCNNCKTTNLKNTDRCNKCGMSLK
jgi:uncharacterized RDD family membrane protein YckC